MISIPGYDLSEKLYEGIHSRVYRGQQKSDKKPVILKLLNKTYPSPVELARFNHEFRIPGLLNLKGVIQVHGLEKINNTLVMVMEDSGGESLDRIIAQGPVTLNDFLPLGIRIADILEQIHQHNVMHKDINPSNIIWNRKNDQVKIIDFGIATELSRENPETCNADILEGTPPYMSPEQTGRMNREDRYQSALGLSRDLEICQKQWQDKGLIGTFTPGQWDVSERFQIPQKLYGREQEKAVLMKAFEMVAQGHTQLILVAGYSGVGKSALVNEIHKPIVEKQGYFIDGKFDQFQTNIPYSALAQAFQELVGQLLSEPEDRLENWKNKLLEALGPNGQIIIQLVPELERIIGRQPPVQELNPTEDRFGKIYLGGLRPRFDGYANAGDGWIYGNRGDPEMGTGEWERGYADYCPDGPCSYGRQTEMPGCRLHRLSVQAVKKSRSFEKNQDICQNY